MVFMAAAIRGTRRGERWSGGPNELGAIYKASVEPALTEWDPLFISSACTSPDAWSKCLKK
eukprot:1156843-Pelagomonas_calceolata.AAC.17